MKDFYDLLSMSRLFAFESVTLAAAIRATFKRRATVIPRERPPPLTHAFSEDPQKLRQWRSFLARDPLLINEPDLQTVIREVGDFIMPVARAAIDDRRMPGRWTSDGGWRPATLTQCARAEIDQKPLGEADVLHPLVGSASGPFNGFRQEPRPRPGQIQFPQAAEPTGPEGRHWWYCRYAARPPADRETVVPDRQILHPWTR